MPKVENYLNRAAMVLGTAMIIAWTMLLGLTGATLLVAVFYAMTTAQDAFVILATFALFAPILTTLVWGCVTAADEALKKLETWNVAEGPSWWQRHSDFRILYQAYYG